MKSFTKTAAAILCLHYYRCCPVDDGELARCASGDERREDLAPARRTQIKI